ncbi:MAG: hypothetical protein ABI652_03675, partial [Acidobacteriota bacterium]
ALDYAHIEYDYQRQLKSEVIADAFRRLGKIALDQPVAVEASPERGYRMRARLHLREGRAGFFREGTHVWCDAAPAGQMLAGSLAAVQAVVGAIGAAASDCESVLLVENVSASERVVHVEFSEATRKGRRPAWIELPEGVTGVTIARDGRVEAIAGSATVTDRAEELFGAAPPVSADTAWARRAPPFFQGNRYLAGALVRHVLELAGDRRNVADLYAGVGLFAVALAAAGATVVAIEGERWSVEDLEANALPWADRLSVVGQSVEDGAATLEPGSRDVVVLDPPRSGLSPRAANAVAALAAPRIVYVSCDPPTLARDAARLAQAGYRLASLRAFDLFPSTAHVEVIAAFDR